MPLSAGQKLGPYELIAAIGEGGMGEVWKARDTRLGRMVAVKVSKTAFGERFEREARTVASLSHPNICILHDVGPDYLVMEYIEGKPVKGPLPVETALAYAVEIAKALDAAHRVGIIHRDLKPGNILVTKSGVKLLDFGLAKMTNAATSAPEETITRALTEEGTILGTLQYMAPEQLEGKDADARSDIFAFGCVLYEMLAGVPAFFGGSRASLIAAIMERTPKPLIGMPPALGSAIQRCLAKDPDDRWQSARDLVGVLELAGAPAITAAPVVRTPRRALGAIAALATVAILAVAAAFWFASRKPQEQFWTGQPVGGPAQALGARVSPDGQRIAFQAMVDGQSQVAIMTPESGNWTVLTHQRDVGQIDDIAWSRDGSKLYYDRDSDVPIGIFSVPVLGGEPRLVLEAADTPGVLADGSLVVNRINAQRETQLYHYWPESGKIEPLPAVFTNSNPSRATPDGRAVIFVGTPLSANGSKGARGIYTLDPESRAMVNVAPRQIFTDSVVPLAATPDGRSIVYADPSDGLTRVISVPRTGSGEMRQLFTMTGAVGYLDVAPDGSIYADQDSFDTMILRFPPTGGVPERLAHVQGYFKTLALVLPDGRPLIYSVAGFKSRFQIVQPGGALTPLIESNEACGLPATLAGDRQVAVLTDRKPLQIAIVSIADGRIVQHVPLKAGSISTLASSPDGATFYYSSEGAIWSMPAAGGEPTKLAPGDGVSADVNGRDLIVSLHDKDAIRLVRVPVSGGAPQPIDVHGDVRIAANWMSTSIAGPGGLLAVATASPGMWYYQAGLIDPHKGTISRIPLNFDGETHLPVWTRDGKLVATGSLLGFTMWRFHPAR